ncbi:F-box protein [Morus notabilis]|uniref:F-box protein n=1 Tax=Morus notabilis TaxID=981085 RepID=W9T030_9ROSA|nr:F-box protein [Morus notabilis]
MKGFTLKRMSSCSSHVENEKDEEKTISLLDLPELILECIFERLLPADLCNMIGVCTFLRVMCTSDHIWEKHLTRKWGKLIGEAAYRKWIGDAAYRAWQAHVASWNGPNFLYNRKRQREYMLKSPPVALRFSRIRPDLVEKSCEASSGTLPVGHVMAFYLALESGKFWFPAQVYYGGNGYTGVTLLCYDAQVSYDYSTDTFRASYPAQVWGRNETNIKWDRLRAPPVDTLDPFTPHVSDYLHDLKPGDHIEIQWKSHDKSPYGWWYALVGHLDQCDENVNHCRCHYSDTLVVEFKQYPPGSIWRRTMLNRKHRLREGNGADRLYGGIRKISDEEEISKWLHYLPN